MSWLSLDCFIKFCQILAVKLKGTVSCPNKVHFIMFCQILAMKLNVCKEITSVVLCDKTVASLLTNVSPRRYNVKIHGKQTR